MVLPIWRGPRTTTTGAIPESRRLRICPTRCRLVTGCGGMASPSHQGLKRRRLSPRPAGRPRSRKMVVCPLMNSVRKGQMDGGVMGGRGTGAVPANDFYVSPLRRGIPRIHGRNTNCHTNLGYTTDDGRRNAVPAQAARVVPGRERHPGISRARGAPQHRGHRGGVRPPRRGRASTFPTSSTSTSRSPRTSPTRRSSGRSGRCGAPGCACGPPRGSSVNRDTRRAACTPTAPTSSPRRCA